MSKKIVFVGSVGIGRCIEEIIDVLNFKINKFEIQLHINGYLDINYKNKLIKRAKLKNCINNLIFN